MPTPKVWASPGGTSPRTIKVISDSNPIVIEEPVAQHTANQGQEEERGREGEDDQAGTWVSGAGDEENRIYKNFLRYCEERREEQRQRLRADEERMMEARKKEAAWELLRTSIKYLKEKDGDWRARKIAECDRIKEEEKRDRLAVAMMKKKRYGVKRLSKEENMRLKMRTEERLEIAKAKTNYWRHHREQDLGRKGEMKEEEALAWQTLKDGIMILEEADGEWIEEEDDMRSLKNTTITIRSPTLKVGGERDEHGVKDDYMRTETKRMGEGSKKVLEGKPNSVLGEVTITSARGENKVTEGRKNNLKPPISRRILSGRVQEKVKKIEEEAVGVKKEILRIEKRLESQPEEGGRYCGKLKEGEGEITGRKRDREDEKEAGATGSGAGGEEWEFADLKPSTTQKHNLKTKMKPKKDGIFIDKNKTYSKLVGVKALVDLIEVRDDISAARIYKFGGHAKPGLDDIKHLAGSPSKKPRLSASRASWETPPPSSPTQPPARRRCTPRSTSMGWGRSRGTARDAKHTTWPPVPPSPTCGSLPVQTTTKLAIKAVQDTATPSIPSTSLSESTSGTPAGRVSSSSSSTRTPAASSEMKEEIRRNWKKQSSSSSGTNLSSSSLKGSYLTEPSPGAWPGTRACPPPHASTSTSPSTSPQTSAGTLTLPGRSCVSKGAEGDTGVSPVVGFIEEKIISLYWRGGSTDAETIIQLERGGKTTGAGCDVRANRDGQFSENLELTSEHHQFPRDIPSTEYLPTEDTANSTCSEEV